MLKGEGHPIKIVARRTGLTPHVIRMWEKRYQAVLPQRTPTNRRLYSEADIERLSLLHRATVAGRSIGQVARLPTKKLQALVTEDEATSVLSWQRPEAAAKTALPHSHLTGCLLAVEQLNADALEDVLTQAAVDVGQAVLLEQVIVPLMHTIGDRWRNGSLRIAHEHMASAVVRTFVGAYREGGAKSTAAPHIIVATLAGQMHELGACLVAATAASEGWCITYLGANLPPEEIAGAAQRRQAKAVALSMVYPADNPAIVQELRQLRRSLPAEVTVIVGGRAADGYSKVLEEIGATRLDDLASFRATLEKLRSQPASGRDWQSRGS